MVSSIQVLFIDGGVHDENGAMQQTLEHNKKYGVATTTLIINAPEQKRPVVFKVKFKRKAMSVKARSILGDRWLTDTLVKSLAVGNIRIIVDSNVKIPKQSILYKLADFGYSQVRSFKEIEQLLEFKRVSSKFTKGSPIMIDNSGVIHLLKYKDGEPKRYTVVILDDQSYIVKGSKIIKMDDTLTTYRNVIKFLSDKKLTKELNRRANEFLDSIGYEGMRVDLKGIIRFQHVTYLSDASCKLVEVKTVEDVTNCISSYKEDMPDMNVGGTETDINYMPGAAKEDNYKLFNEIVARHNVTQDEMEGKLSPTHLEELNSGKVTDSSLRQMLLKLESIIRARKSSSGEEKDVTKLLYNEDELDLVDSDKSLRDIKQSMLSKVEDEDISDEDTDENVVSAPNRKLTLGQNHEILAAAMIIQKVTLDEMKECMTENQVELFNKGLVNKTTLSKLLPKVNEIKQRKNRTKISSDNTVEINE